MLEQRAAVGEAEHACVRLQRALSKARLKRVSSGETCLGSASLGSASLEFEPCVAYAQAGELALVLTRLGPGRVRRSD